jgi:tetratricopeptide (TPR) repeat protein
MGRFSKLERGKGERQTAGKGAVAAVTEAGAAPAYDAPFYTAQADELFFTGKYEKALRLYSRALQLDNSQKWPWVGQIYCLIEMNQLREADLWVGRALELFPEDATLIALRAVVYGYMGMVKRAVGTSDYALSKGSTTHSWIARGHVLLVTDNKNSRFCFEKAMEIAESGDWRTPMLIGLVYFRHKSLASALEYFLKAAESNVNNYYLWYHIARCYHHLSFEQKALDAVQRALEIEPQYRPAQRLLRDIAHTPVWKQLWRFLTKRIF